MFEKGKGLSCWQMSCSSAVLTTTCEGSVLSTCAASQAAWYLAAAMHLLRLLMFNRVANMRSRPNLMAASTISCLSAFSVSSLTTKFTCLLSSRNLPLYCCLNSCIQASTCSVETLLGRLSFKVLMAPRVSNVRTWLEESSGSALRFLPRCPSTGKAPDDPGFSGLPLGLDGPVSNGLKAYAE